MKLEKNMLLMFYPQCSAQSFSAKKGALAIVIDPEIKQIGHHKCIKIKWLDDLAGKQEDGYYMPEWFKPASLVV